MLRASICMACSMIATSSLFIGATARERDEVVQEVPRSGVVELGLPFTQSRGGGGGEAHGPNVNTTQNSRPQNETSIAMDPNNPLNLVGGTNDYRYGDSDAGVSYSLDGGATWSADTLVGLNAASGKYSTQGDPALAAYRDGVFYYAYIDFDRNTDQNRLPVAKSFDGGVTWPQIGVIIDHSGGGSHDFEDKEYIAVDNTGGTHDGNVYVSWTRFPVSGGNRIMLSRSTDGGLTFSAPMQISDNTGLQGSVPAVGPSGEVYVAWIRAGRIEIDKSTDGGATWGTDRLVSTVQPIPSPLPGASYRVNSFPTLAVDRTNGNVYVAWADNRGPDIWFSRSTDGGTTFSAPIVVSDDVNGSYQFFPWMSVAPGGAIDIVFFDRRTNPNSVFYRTFAARSTDGGLSFGANEQISDALSDSRNDGFGGGFIGDYNGIVSRAGGAHPLWTDTRSSTGNAEGFTVSLDYVEAICPDDPDDFVRVLGGPATGNALDLCDDDEVHLQVRFVARFNPLLPSIQLEYWAHTALAGDTISQLDYHINCHVTAVVPGGQRPDTLRTSIRNYTAGNWSLRDQRATPSNADVDIDIQVTANASDYVSAADGEIRVRQDVFNPGNVAFPLWFLKVDQYEVTVTP